VDFLAQRVENHSQFKAILADLIAPGTNIRLSRS
jgi:hypothetical protein